MKCNPSIINSINLDGLSVEKNSIPLQILILHHLFKPDVYPCLLVSRHGAFYMPVPVLWGPGFLLCGGAPV